MQNVTEVIIRIFSVSAVRYFVIAGLPFLLFYKVFSGYFGKSKIQGSQADRKDFIREILYSMQTTAVFTVIAMLVLFTPLKQHTLIYNKLSDYPI
jgi:lathosterol oxidase